MAEWNIDLNGIKARELPQFQSAFNDLQTKGLEGIEGFYIWAAKIVKSWPFASDPSDAAGYGDLGLLDWREMINKVTAAFQSITGGFEDTADGGGAGGTGSTTGTSESA